MVDEVKVALEWNSEDILIIRTKRRIYRQIRNEAERLNTTKNTSLRFSDGSCYISKEVGKT